MTWWLIKGKNGRLRYRRELPKHYRYSVATKLKCDWCDKEADRIIDGLYVCQEHWEEFNK